MSKLPQVSYLLSVSPPQPSTDAKASVHGVVISASTPKHGSCTDPMQLGRHNYSDLATCNKATALGDHSHIENVPVDYALCPR